MASIQLSDEAKEKLQQVLAEEGKNACVRLRVYKVGAACHAKMVPGLSIDEMDDLEDTLLATIDGISFIAEEEFVAQQGNVFSISIQEGTLTLTAEKQ